MQEPEFAPIDAFRDAIAEDLPRNRRGGGPYIPTDRERAMVRLLAATGVDRRLVAEALKLRPRSFERAFERELALGSVELIALAVSTVKALLETGPDEVRWKAAEFVLRTAGNMAAPATTRPILDITAESARRVHNGAAAVEQLSPEEAAVIGRLLERRAQ